MRRATRYDFNLRNCNTARYGSWAHEVWRLQTNVRKCVDKTSSASFLAFGWLAYVAAAVCQIIPNFCLNFIAGNSRTWVSAIQNHCFRAKTKDMTPFSRTILRQKPSKAEQIVSSSSNEGSQNYMLQKASWELEFLLEIDSSGRISV